jgi:hypothetical protein
MKTSLFVAEVRVRPDNLFFLIDDRHGNGGAPQP